MVGLRGEIGGGIKNRSSSSNKDFVDIDGGLKIASMLDIVINEVIDELDSRLTVACPVPRIHAHCLLCRCSDPERLLHHPHRTRTHVKGYLSCLLQWDQGLEPPLALH